MKKYTYLKKDEENLTLVFEEYTDENGNVIYSKDYQADPISEKILRYNASGFLTEETEITEGVELSKTDFLYNEQDENIKRTLYIGGELYETLITSYHETGYESITIREGVEVERQVKTINGKDYANKFYENGKLVETHVCESDSFENRTKTMYYGSNGELLFTKMNTYDDSGMLLNFEEYNADNVLLKKSSYEIQDGLVLSEIYGDYVNGTFEYHTTYEYDEYRNVVKCEKRQSRQDRIIGFYFCKYDDKNRLIEESGLALSWNETLYASYFDEDEYHFIHVYE